MANNPLKLYFIPYPASSHLIPLTEMARLMANHGQDVTIITTEANVGLLEKHVSTNLSLHIVELPKEEASLGNGNYNPAAKNYFTTIQMRPGIEEFITSNPPDCIISDAFYPWTSDLAAQVGAQRLVFRGWGMFAMCVMEVLRGFKTPPNEAESAYEQFEIPGLPDRVMITRSQVPDSTNVYSQLMEVFREAELKSYGIVVNDFYELESAYSELYKKIMGHTVWNIGPAFLINRNAGDKAKRSHKAVVGQQDFLGWLDTKRHNSVVYICFGSVAATFTDEQLYEIACALRSCGVEFIWVVLGKENEVADTNTTNWLPQGFEEMIRETGKGMIVRGWAPQLLILDHPAIGGFLTHCGWSSIIEGITAGVPMVTWPLCDDQFYNEKLVVQILKVGVQVGVMDWNLLKDAEKKLVTRENIEAPIKKVMYDANEGAQMRRKAKELKEKAKQAMEEGGSSHQNLVALIQALNQIKNGNLKNK